MVYTNPNGHDWGSNYNWDGLGLSYVAFGAVYSLVFFLMCAIVWANRKHPVVKMRNIGIAISSLLILHVYLFMIFIAYGLNGYYPCDVEFWVMSIYLPIGIGLFQAQNQQLLLVSREQSKIVFMDDIFKPLAPASPGVKRWNYKFRQLLAKWSEQTRYEGLVAIGMVVQLVMSTVIFLISRKFTGVGFVSEHVSQGMCRRGWEWAPSIAWQLLWNWILGPVLIWKIRMIRDIYHWRLQTILCIVAGLPGSPMWIIMSYGDNFSGINKYWIPSAWFVPGLVTMELVTLGFPIYQVYHHKRAVYQTTKAIMQWEANKDLTLTGGSSINSGASQCYSSSLSELDKCLHTNYWHFLIYCCNQAFAGENVKFLLKVIGFKRAWDNVFAQAGQYTDRACMVMFKSALELYLAMVYEPTAIQQINVEAKIYGQLRTMFEEAAKLVASDRPPTPSSTRSVVAPWDEPLIDQSNDRNERIEMANLVTRNSSDAESARRVLELTQPVEPNDRLIGFHIPGDFSKAVFDAAYGSVKQMVWQDTWPKYLSTTKNMDQRCEISI